MPMSHGERSAKTKNKTKQKNTKNPRKMTSIAKG